MALIRDKLTILADMLNSGVRPEEGVSLVWGDETERFYRRFIKLAYAFGRRQRRERRHARPKGPARRAGVAGPRGTS